MPREYLAETADAILDAALAALAPDITGHPAPSKVFVSHGDPVMDLDGCCDSGGTLAVHLGRPQSGVPIRWDSLKTPCMVLTRSAFTVSLFRCVPVFNTDQPGYAPTEDELTASANDLLTDLWCLICGLREAIRAGDIQAGGCDDVRLTESRTVEPQGGCAGWQVTLELQANDGGPGVGS